MVSEGLVHVLEYKIMLVIACGRGTSPPLGHQEAEQNWSHRSEQGQDKSPKNIPQWLTSYSQAHQLP